MNEPSGADDVRGGPAGGLERTAFEYAGRQIEFTIRRSARRRTVGLTIELDGSVHVAAPTRMAREPIAAFVRQKAAWIVKHQLRLASLAQRDVPQERGFGEGDQLPFLGEPLRLHFVAPADGVPPQVWRADSVLCIRGIPPAHHAEDLRREAVRRLLTSWYQTQALEYFSVECAGYAAQLGLAAPQVSIGDPRRRWGSCSSRGSLRFSWRLLLAPRALAEYVAAHEVAHRLELNHSLRFWRIVARLMPDFKQRERELAGLAGQLVL